MKFTYPFEFRIFHEHLQDSSLLNVVETQLKTRHDRSEDARHWPWNPAEDWKYFFVISWTITVLTHLQTLRELELKFSLYMITCFRQSHLHECVARAAHLSLGS